jgi:hypothetical protein
MASFLGSTSFPLDSKAEKTVLLDLGWKRVVSTLSLAESSSAESVCCWKLILKEEISDTQADLAALPKEHVDEHNKPRKVIFAIKRITDN